MESNSFSKSPALSTLLPASPLPHSRRAKPVSQSLIGKRAVVATACGACRKRKAKCSGNRPRCVSCIQRQLQCVYDRGVDETQAKAVKRKYEELKSHKTPEERIYDAIRSRSELDAATIVQKIRRGESVDDIARQVEHGDLLLQSCLIPETRYRYEFPVSSCMPPYVLLESNPYLDSLIYEWSPALPPTKCAAGPPASHNKPSDVSAEAFAPYLKPYHAAEIVDAYLSSIVPSKWTSVCTDDVLMRRLFSAFFLQDHDWWTSFHKDYFLEDMSKMKLELCSSLLVNAVLALSCNYYRGLSQRTEFWNPQTLGYRFLAEAKRLWEYEQDTQELTTIQAALILHVIYAGSGADKIGIAYTIQACTIAGKIGLFQPVYAIADSRLRDARLYTAWALYSWQSLMCFHYFRPPLINDPPTALPDPGENPRWYGEIWLKYPLGRTLHPSNSADVFRAKAEFAVIMNDLGRSLFTGALPAPPLSSQEVAHYYSRFKGWYDKLPAALSPRRAVLPSHLKIHMHYFQILLRLLQSPSILSEQGSEQYATLIDLFGQPPQQLLLNAKASFETLLRAYYLRHGFEWLDTYLVSLLMENCFMAIDDMKGSNNQEKFSALRSTVILLAKGIYEQGQNFFLGQLVFHLVKDKMCPDDLELLEHFVKIEPVGKSQVVGLQQVQMEWPVEITNMMEDPESRRLGYLVEKLKGSILTVLAGENNS